MTSMGALRNLLPGGLWSPPTLPLLPIPPVGDVKQSLKRISAKAGQPGRSRRLPRPRLHSPEPTLRVLSTIV
jgi:hypothetical protein